MDLTRADWRKSSRSSGNGGECVEVAGNVPGVILVRDSKNAHGPALPVTPTIWRAFTEQLKTTTGYSPAP